MLFVRNQERDMNYDIAFLQSNPPRIIFTNDSDFVRMVFEANVKVAEVVFYVLPKRKDYYCRKVLHCFRSYPSENLINKVVAIFID